MTCTAYIRTYWRLLLVRWAVFAGVALAIAFFTGQDLKAIWPAALHVAGIANIAWIWVA